MIPFIRRFILLAGSLLFACSAGAAEQAAPTIPYGGLHPYTVSFEEEMLESMQVDRLWLRGNIEIKMDPIPGHRVEPAQGQASARFALRNATGYTIDFLAFPSRSFGHRVDNDTLNAYLDGLALRHKPEQAFKVIRHSEFRESGPSDFRLLGKRAHHIRYSYVKEETRHSVAESWVEDEGTIYLVRVTAPSSGFEIQVREAQNAFANMSKQ